MTSGAGLPPMRALAKSGNCVAEWLPQMAMLVTSATGTPALRASWALARFWSSRVIANQRSSGISGAFDRAMRQLVLQGLPTTRTRTSDGGVFGDRPALRLEDAAVHVEQVPSLHARPCAGTEPTSSAHDDPSKAVLRSTWPRCRQQREGAVVELHTDALERLHGRLDLEQAKHDGLVVAEQLARGDAEEERVADLAGGAGNRDVDWGLAPWQWSFLDGTSEAAAATAAR